MCDTPNETGNIISTKSPSLSHPPSVHCEPIPEGILAFRTSTLILSQLSNKQKSPHNNVLPAQEDSRREARVADAFACIAVINNEIVSVSTHCSSATQNTLSSATGSKTGPASEAQIAQGKKPLIRPRIYGFFCTKNYRPQETDPMMRNESAFPVVVDPIPLAIGKESLETYLRGMQSAWSVQDDLR